MITNKEYFNKPIIYWNGPWLVILKYYDKSITSRNVRFSITDGKIVYGEEQCMTDNGIDQYIKYTDGSLTISGNNIIITMIANNDIFGKFDIVATIDTIEPNITESNVPLAGVFNQNGVESGEFTAYRDPKPLFTFGDPYRGFGIGSFQETISKK